MNPEIFLVQGEVEKLVKVLAKLVERIGSSGLKRILLLCDMDISDSTFPANPRECAQEVTLAFKQYRVSEDHPDYHPLVSVLEYLLAVYVWEADERQFFTALLTRGKKNLAILASQRKPDVSLFPLSPPYILPMNSEQSEALLSSSHYRDTSQSGISNPSNFSMPRRGDSFLTQSERNRIVAIVTTVIKKTPAAYLLTNSGIPDNVIEDINYNQGFRKVAIDIVITLEKEGSLESPEYHALGAFLSTLIAEGVGYNAGNELAVIIFRYNLIKNKERVQELSSYFQVPSPIFITERPSASIALPEWLHLPDQEERLESLYTSGISHYVEPNFLRKGANLVRSICRVEFRGTAEGTGFLVAPDLVLTNYHVLMPTGYAGTIEERARICAVRFGAIRNSKDEVILFELADKGWCLASSKPDDLDYLLLRLKRPISQRDRVVPISLTQRGQEYVNIIHHPQGSYMAVSLRYNQVVAIRGKQIFYLADTEKRSSGAPVFNDNWQIVALHRSGGEKDAKGNLLFSANAGILIELIFQQIGHHLK